MLRDGAFTLSRGLGNGLAPILLVVPAGDYSSLESLQRLEHEFALRAELDADWAARPVELLRRDVRHMLVLEDHGGEPLQRLLGQPLDIATFLRIAIPLSAALGQMHARGLIHKDVRPANILVDTASGHVWLTGFGIASRLPREHQAPAPPEVIAGTLAYMAPEQTGRMNRSVDMRSDLYSLGISFYEMLTGTLPFTAADPMEWVHCHIARRPVPASERLSTVPAQLSAIVSKLIAKTAEDRYQTAAGLTFDLQRCLADWQASGRIESFTLGSHDTSDRLLIPEHLYGRHREIDVLVSAFDRVVAQGTPELVLVSGYSGIGKSSVVNELHKVLVPPRGLFASGKFDQYKRDIPYATLAQAFQSLVRPLLGQSKAELGRWRDALREALGPNGQLIVNLIPEIELVIGKQPPVPELPPQAAQVRLQLVFRRLIGVFARPEHPLALFLDDLQWLDAATLDLLQHLVTHPEMRHLLLVGAYRDNEVGPAHPLVRTLETIRAAGAPVHEILLAPLRRDDVGRLVADALHCGPERALPLAELVHDKTGGNPFFVIQFLTALADEALLAFDPETSAWQWDMHRIRAKGYTDNVVELMAGKLTRLPDATQDALKLLACMGNVTEIATLAMMRGEPAHDDPQQALHAALWEAVRAGLLFRLESAYAFPHDRIHQAAYSLIPAAHRADIHLRIGRALLANMTAEALDENVFEVANQLNWGAALLVDRDERTHVARIDLHAGRKAKASAAYASACVYLAAGMAQLDERDWDSQYELTFRLWLTRAECEYLSGNFEVAEGLITELLARAASNIDKAAAYCLKVDLHVMKSQNPQGVESALECLRLFGIEMPAHPTREQVDAEYEKVWKALGDRSIESLIDLPLMIDSVVQAAMRVLAVLFAPAYFTDINLLRLHLCHMVILSVTYGTTDVSAQAYTWFGTTLGATSRRYADGYRFGKVACDLIERHGFVASRAKTWFPMELVVIWTQPLETALEYIRATFRAGVEAGDVALACFSCNHAVTNLLTRGAPLAEVWRESERGLDFVRKARFRDVIDIVVSQQRFIDDMRGRTASFSSFDDAQFDEASFEAELTDDRMATMVCWYWVIKTQARFMSGDYEAALAASRKAKALLWSSDAHIQLLDYHYYSALAMAAAYQTVPLQRQREWRGILAAHQEQLGAWAESYFPTFGDKHALVSAELARLDGRELEAMHLYEDAIRLARTHGFVQHEGIAYELAARFYAARGYETFAHAYQRNARDCYRRWGAEGKVRQLEQLHPQLLREDQGPAPTALIGVPVAQLDVGAVVKASHAISGEIVLGQLIETLMTIALEHAGAERGLLILLDCDTPQIEAEASTGHGRVEVVVRQAEITSADLPPSALQYVLRTRDRVVLDDASASEVYAEDPYVRQRRPRSVLCLPIVEQATLVGALYLENNLTPRAFTADRVAVLELLASQAAISLENARLYAGLLAENRDRQRAEDELRRSEASLLDAQQISHTASWRWNVDTGEVAWSGELSRMLAIDVATPLSYEAYMQRVHADDRPAFEHALSQAARERRRFQHEHRLLLPDGSVKFMISVGRPDVVSSGAREYVGVIMDITERRRAEEALRDSQAELARVARLTTMGELAASIAHEINQPLAAIVMNGSAGMRWLNETTPDVGEARKAFARVVSDGQRAGEVIRGLRGLSKKSGPHLTTLDIDDVIREVLTLTRSEIQRHGIVLRTDLAAGDRMVLGDGVQLQQVLMNLILNGIDAMSAVTGRARELMVTSAVTEPGIVLVSVEDSGTGLDQATALRMFEPFFTTKADGLGMGLSICRSIIEAHDGRLWVSPREPHGTALRFTVPLLSS